MRTHLCRLSIGLASALAFADASGAASEANSDWPAYLGDKGRSLYSPLRQINRSEEHTSELQSRRDLVCRLLLEKKKNTGRDHAGSESQRRPTRAPLPATQGTTRAHAD